MAIYHLSIKPVSRGGGRSGGRASAYRSGSRVVASAAYRSAERLEQGGEVHDYTRRHGVLFTEILAPNGHPPAWVFDRQKLWSEVAAREDKSTRKSTALEAREFELSIPAELKRYEQEQLVRSWVLDNLTQRGMVADVAIHQGPNPLNVHAHILVTTRLLNEEGKFGNKVKRWGQKKALYAWRQSWAEAQNKFLGKGGHEARVSELSLEKQGVKRRKPVKLTRVDVAMEEKGIATQRGNRQLQVKIENTTRAIEEARLDRMRQPVSGKPTGEASTSRKRTRGKSNRKRENTMAEERNNECGMYGKYGREKLTDVIRDEGRKTRKALGAEGRKLRETIDPEAEKARQEAERAAFEKYGRGRETNHAGEHDAGHER